MKFLVTNIKRKKEIKVHDIDADICISKNRKIYKYVNLNFKLL